jgi:hypothetical protein
MKHLLVYLACLLPALAAHAQDPAPSKKPIKIYIIAGQSNAEQRGNMDWMRDTWPEYGKVDPKLWHFHPGAKPPSPFNGETYAKFGVEFVPGIEISKRVENDVIFLSTAVGGTTLRQRWTSPTGAKRLGCEVGNLYERMFQWTYDLIRNAGEIYPRYAGQEFEIAGIIWFQGENDSLSYGNFPFYQDLFIDFINDVRHDFGVPDLPIFICKINDAWCERIGGGEVIRRANENAIQKLHNVEAIHTHDLHEKAHYDGAPSYMVISRRLADIMVPYCEKPVHADMEAVKVAMQRFLDAHKPAPARKRDMASLKEGLIDYYQFEDLTAASSVNVTKGELVSDETFGKPVRVGGKFGNSIKLHGKQGLVFPGYKDPVNGEGMIEQLSVSFWARNFGGSGIYRIGKGKGKPFESNSPRGTLDTWFLSDQANDLGWDLRGFSGGSFGITNSVLKQGKPRTFGAFTSTGMSGSGADWVHMVLVYDGKNREIRTYRNGELCDFKRCLDAKYQRGKHEKRMEGEDGVPIAPIRSAADIPLSIGGEMKASSEFQCYDELAFWSRPLTEEEVQKLYNGGAGSQIPVK